MTAPTQHSLSLWRRLAASLRGRALVAALAVAVFGWQLALQGHVLGHDLAAVDGPCAFALQVNQATPLASTAPAVADDPQRHAAPVTTLTDLTLDQTPLRERARGPPSHLA